MARPVPDLDRDPSATPVESKRLRRALWVLGGLSVVALALAAWIFGPSPPRKIVMAAGQSGGVYTEHARSYQARLSRIGLEVTVVETNGSLDNLERLLRREVHVAFVQGGTYSLVDDPDGKLRGLAAIYFEPLWLFHRDAKLTSIAALHGRRLSIGPRGSGTSAVAAALLREYEIPPEGPLVERLPDAVARERLEGGQIDAAFFVTSYRNPTVLALLRRPDIRLFSVNRGGAHARKFAALQPLKLYEGIIDLRNNVPAEDKTLLAAPALLASRDDLHPRVVEQILKVANAIHRPGSLLDPPLRFPSLDGLDIPPHEAAEVYLTQGESLLSRTLPYPVLRWTLILRVLVLPLLILWLPVLRLLPEISKWRMDRHFGRLYAMLRRIEEAIRRADRPEEVQLQIDQLDRIAAATAALCRKIPASGQRDVYHWRLHVALVRDDAVARLARLEAAELTR